MIHLIMEVKREELELFKENLSIINSSKNQTEGLVSKYTEINYLKIHHFFDFFRFSASYLDFSGQGLFR